MNNVDDLTRIKWLRLIRSLNVGPKTFHNLLQIYENIDNIIENIPQMSVKGGLKKPLQLLDFKDAEKEYENTIKYGAEIILSCEDFYPKLLKTIYDYPPIITVKGEKSYLKNKSIAIVGSRNASLAGKKIAYYFAKEFAENNYCVISGLARGIDTAAHKGCLDYPTIAVTGCGIDKIYPTENIKLYSEIAEYGAIISEMPFGTSPKAQNFPKRNRIISGLSIAVLIVEATINSGSLITANCALEQSRELFAIPGSPVDYRSSGTNKLIKEGAYLAQTAYDVIDVVDSNNIEHFMHGSYDDSIQLEKITKISDSEKNEARSLIISQLNSSPCNFDDLASETSLPINLIINTIIELELAGKIERHFGNEISLI